MDTVQLWKLYGCGWAKFWIWTTCWLCGWNCGVVNCMWSASKPLVEGPAKALGSGPDSSFEVWLWPLTKWLKILDMFSFCWKDARALYDSIDWSQWFMPSYRFNVSCFHIVVRQNSHCSSSYTVICKMGLNTSFLAHLLHHTAVHGLADWGITNHTSSLRGRIKFGWNGYGTLEEIA